jgi:two-component system, LuxR family, sensor kinase FixL
MDLTLAAGLRRPERFAIFIAIGVAALALAAVIGWQVGSVPLTSVLVGSVALQPATALALILGAMGLAAAAIGYRALSAATGAVLLAVCVTWLSADVVRRTLPIDLLLYRGRVLAQSPAPLWPGRPSLITCVVIALFAASLLGVGLRQPRLRLLAVGAASLGALLASLSLLPYALQDSSQLSVLNQNLRIAVNTSIAIGGLCAGALILMRDTGWVRIVAGGGERGRLARLLAPMALVPVGLGMLANFGVRMGFYGPDVRMLLIIELSACALLFLAFWAAQTLGYERQERDSLASALERSTVMVVDGDGRLRHWAPACEALYGWTAAEVLGRRPGEFLNVEGASVREATRAAIRDRGEWRDEIRHWTKSGEVRWVALQWARQDRTVDGEARFVGTISDITDLKLAEASLRESEERLRLAVGAYDLGIADADLTTGKLIAEGGFERLLGLPDGGLKGDLDRLRDMMVSADPARDEDIAAGRPQQVDSVRMRRADGEIRDFQGVRRFFYSPEGAHVRTIGIYRDVTSERRAQAELALRGDRLTELRTELAHVSRLSAMGEMAAALAHELNQPLTAIGNTVGALKLILGDGGRTLDDATRARVVRAADQAEGQAVRAGEIVRRLRDFIARGEADARIEEVKPLIEDSVALAAPNAKAEQIEVRLKLSPKADRVLADRIQIQQILVNLIRNATEAMRETAAPRVLTISTTARRGMVEVAVKDTGPGVPPDLAKRLFSPFLSTKTSGMGVGLSICRRIVEAHGGRMWLEDSQGGGADFRFTAPLASKELRDAE